MRSRFKPTWEGANFTITMYFYILLGGFILTADSNLSFFVIRTPWLSAKSIELVEM